MAYTTATLNCVVPGVGGSPALWIYTTTDAHTAVDAAGYFTDGAAKGLKANDVVIVVDTDSATTTIHGAIDATSINVATLA